MGKVQIKQCVLLCWKARQHLVDDWPYIRAFQMTIPEIIIVGLHCLCSVCTSEQRAHVETCVGARYHTISERCDIARSANLQAISRYCAIDMNPTLYSLFLQCHLYSLLQ